MEKKNSATYLDGNLGPDEGDELADRVAPVCERLETLGIGLFLEEQRARHADDEALRGQQGGRRKSWLSNIFD